MMPDEEISIEDKKIKYGFFNRRTPISRPLFPQGIPLMSEVVQGYTDLDCYFLSVLAGAAKKDPKIIISCFPDYPHSMKLEEVKKFNSNSKVKIRFYKVLCEYDAAERNYYYKPNGTINITVDRTALRGGGAPWVRILEKAYAIYRSKGYDQSISEEDIKAFRRKKKIDSRIIDGTIAGDAASVLVTITGKKSKYYQVGDVDSRERVKKFSGDYSKSNAIFEKIKYALSKGQIVTAGASKGIKLYSKGLFLNHIYTVIGTEIKEGKKFIVVRNPYANRIRTYKADSKGKMHSEVKIPKNKEEKGISRLELNDFYKYFDAVHFTGNETEEI